jgi:hypothetical protein
VTSDITIISASCHPDKRKIATFKNWIHRLNKLPLSKTNRVKKLHTIINIAENDGYNKQQIIKLYNLEEKSDWGTLVPRINVENGIKLGFLLE